jgi:hypothetical protein
MASSGTLHSVALVRTDVSEELIASIIRVARNGELRGRSVLRFLVTANVVSSSPIVTLMMEALSSSETSVITRATPRNIPEDAILHSQRSENLNFYILNEFFGKPVYFSSRQLYSVGTELHGPSLLQTCPWRVINRRSVSREDRPRQPGQLRALSVYTVLRSGLPVSRGQLQKQWQGLRHL